MFFPERITGIGSNDRVLEVGPGGTPFVRANVLLERAFADDDHARKQRGSVDADIGDQRLVFYDGGQFPFEDREFDYVICSHVVEHVADVPFLLSELSRVASRGYIEYPTIYYEYLYNFSVHLNFVKFRNGKLYYMAKKETSIDEFLPVQRFFYHSLEMGHSQLVDALRNVMVEGFEWKGSIRGERAESLCDLMFDEPIVPDVRQKRKSTPKALATRLRRMLNKGG